MSPVHPSCYESTASVGCDVIHSISKEPNFPELSLYLRLPVFSLKSTWSNQANTLCSSVIYHTVPYPGTPLVHFPSMGAHNAGFSFWLLWLPSRPFVCCSWAFCVESEWHSFGFTHFLFFFSSTSARFLQLHSLVLRQRPVVLLADFLSAISEAAM